MNPFANSVAAPKAPVAPVAATVAPAAPTAAPAAPTAAPVAPTAMPTATTEGAPKEPKPRKTRKTPNRQMTNDERKYVLNNYEHKSTNDIAQELGLTRQQVYRTVHESRKNLQARLEAFQAEPQSAERDSNIAKIQAMLNKLPAKPFGGGNIVGGKRRQSVDSVLDELMGDM